MKTHINKFNILTSVLSDLPTISTVYLPFSPFPFSYQHYTDICSVFVQTFVALCYELFSET